MSKIQAIIASKRQFPRLSALVFLATFMVSLAIWPSGDIAAAFGADPHDYGEVLVYDTITSNANPGNPFIGGYNGYPHQPEGIELPIGMYRVKATWNGTFLNTRIYQRNAFDNATCDDNYAGMLLGPAASSSGTSLDAGHIAVNPLQGQNRHNTGFLCTYIYLNWNEGVSLRIQIYRVYGPEYQQTDTTLTANVPVDAYATTDYYYQWYLSSYVGVITASLTIDWAYARRGVITDLQNDPHPPSETLDPDNCITIFNAAGFSDYICANQSNAWNDSRIAEAPIQITTRAHSDPVIFHIEISGGPAPATPTPTASVTPTGTAVGCGGSGAGIGVQQVPTQPPPNEPPPATPTPDCISPTPAATDTPAPTATEAPIPSCPITSLTQVIIPQSPSWQIVPMEPNYIIFSVSNAVFVEYPYNSTDYQSIPFTPIRWSSIGGSGWFRFHSEAAPASLAICNPPAATATPTRTPTTTATTTATMTPIATPSATASPLPTATPTPGGAFPSPIPSICPVLEPTPFSNVGPVPDLSFNLPPVAILTDTVTTTVQISITAIIGSLYEMQDTIGTPVAMLQTSTGQFNLEAGQTTVSGMVSYLQPGLEWVSILNPNNPAYFSGSGPLWALAPVLRPLLPIVIASMLISFVRLLLWFISFIVNIIEIILKVAALAS